MTNQQRFSTTCFAVLGLVVLWTGARVYESNHPVEHGYTLSVLQAIQAKSPAQNMDVEPAFNPQKVSFNLYLSPLPAKELRK